MSAETLRRAAARIRVDYMEGREHLVADLLERLANENGDFLNDDHEAMAVARAYLGETA